MLRNIIDTAKFKSFILLVVIVILLLTFSSLAAAEVVLVLGGYQTVDTGNPEKCSEGLYPWDRGLCFQWNAVFYKEEKYCKLVEEEGMRDYCYNLLAIYSGIEKHCDKIVEDVVSKELCYLEVKAINRQNPTLCEESEFSEGCYQHVSWVLDDWELCYKSFAAPQCLMNIIKRQNDIELCRKIKGEYDNSFCYTYFAIKEKEPSLCESSDTPERCYFDAAINLLDLELCSKAGYDESSCKDKVTRLQARLNNDISMCEQAGSDKYICYDDFALLRNDEELCKKSDWEEICLEMLQLKREASNGDIDSSPKDEKPEKKTVIIGEVEVDIKDISKEEGETVEGELIEEDEQTFEEIIGEEETVEEKIELNDRGDETKGEKQKETEKVKVIEKKENFIHKIISWILSLFKK